MKNDEGFAMADAIIALVVISLFGTSILTANMTMTKASRAANLRLEATLIMRVIVETDLKRNSGTISRSGEVFDWKRTVSPSASFPGLKQVHAEVSWKGPGGMRYVDFSGLRPEAQYAR